MTHGRVTAPQMEDKGFADVGDDSLKTGSYNTGAVNTYYYRRFVD